MWAQKHARLSIHLLAGWLARSRTRCFISKHTHTPFSIGYARACLLCESVCSVSSPKIVCLYLDYINWKLRVPHGGNRETTLNIWGSWLAMTHIPYTVQISSINIMHTHSHPLSVIEFSFPIKNIRRHRFLFTRIVVVVFFSILISILLLNRITKQYVIIFSQEKSKYKSKWRDETKTDSVLD